MSLKAKIEAVLYAAEEPVTLAQLAFLFGSEVLEAAEQNATLTGTAFIETGVTETALESDQPEQDFAKVSSEAPEAAIEPDASAAPETQPEGATGGTIRTTDSAPDSAALDEKKSARLRDRAIRDGLKAIVDQLIEEYASGDRGMEVREIAGGYRVATKPEYHDAVRAFAKSLKPPMKLSLQALETLAVIAYKQPVTAPEVNEIRGVDSGGVLGSLLSRKLIATAGRKQVIGRPILYKTTREFLLRFGLKDVSELPSIEEFEKMAGDLDVDTLGTEDDVAHSAHLPFGEGAEEADSNGDNAVEANAGEPGVAVSRPAESSTAAASEPNVPAKLVPLNSSLAQGAAPDRDLDLVTAVDPVTTVSGV